MDTLDVFKTRIHEMFEASWPRRIWLSICLLGLSLYFIVAMAVVQFVKILSTSCFLCH